jgi:ABC-type ATPase with predicted acetyltransferase domain
VQTYNVRLQSEVSKTFRCTMAANSLDIDSEKKSVHELSIKADLTSPFSVGLLVGASGSGKTTLAKQIFGDDVFKTHLDESKPIIDQLPKELSYDECSSILAGVGLTSVPCWIRPVYTLSNGQKARAEAALAMTKNADLTVIDEWTSVVDRTVAKVMSHCVQKHARKAQKKIILLSCHYDVIEWLNPDWVIDCNKQEFIDRRLLPEGERKRREQLEFSIRRVGRETWKYFSKYHYLSSKLPGGDLYLFGLFHGDDQIGFQCFANYVPHSNKAKQKIYHSNRTVIHPDYAGMGLGIHLINETSKYMHENYPYRIMAKFSSTPIFKMMSRYSFWKLNDVKRQIGKTQVGNIARQHGFRENVKTYSFEFVGSRIDRALTNDAHPG